MEGAGVVEDPIGHHEVEMGVEVESLAEPLHEGDGTDATTTPYAKLPPAT